MNSGNAVVALLGHPDQLARLQTHPEGWPNAVEEVLRYDSVFQLTARVATETLHIDGHTVRGASAIFLLAGGANRDPAIFERPDEFDTTRANARDHMSFGTGIHVCLGAALARMELHIGLQTLFERFPRLTLAGEPTLKQQHPAARNQTSARQPRSHQRVVVQSGRPSSVRAWSIWANAYETISAVVIVPPWWASDS